MKETRNQPQNIYVTDKYQQGIPDEYFEKKLRPAASFNEINPAVNKEYHSDDPENHMLKLIPVKYFASSVHITNVKTLFTMLAYLHKVPELHDERR